MTERTQMPHTPLEETGLNMTKHLHGSLHRGSSSTHLSPTGSQVYHLSSDAEFTDFTSWTSVAQ